MKLLQDNIYPVLSSDEVLEIDKICSSDYFLSSEILMENVGILMAQRILSIYDFRHYSFAIVVGTGGNGGDGIVVARYLFSAGYKVAIFVLGYLRSFSYPALNNFKIASALGIAVFEVFDYQKWHDYKNRLNDFDVVVDAIFGVGLLGNIRGFKKNVIDDINKQQYRVVSLDVPSGIVNDTDCLFDSIIRADYTLTVYCPKIAIVSYPGRDFAGTLHVIDLPIPSRLLFRDNFSSFLINDALFRDLVPVRHSDSNKGDFGHVLVIAGSSSCFGAAFLACKAALRSGCGKVTLASVSFCCERVILLLPEILTLSLPENEFGQIDKLSTRFFDNLDQYSVIVYGMGIGVADSHNYFLLWLIKNYLKPIILDADALNNLAILFRGDSEIDLGQVSFRNNLLFTPHVKEMSRLLNLSVDDLFARKHSLLRDFVFRFGVNVLLKDFITLFFSFDDRVYYSSRGNEGMATAGSGDVLAGIIAAFLAQGKNVCDATLIAVHLHGYAGDIARDAKSSFSLIAGDLIDFLPDVFLKF